MDDSYRLSVVFYAVDETFSLREAFEGIDRFHLAYEYLFVLAKNCTDGCLQTAEDLCARDDCRYMIQTNPGLGNAIQESILQVRGSHMLGWSSDGATDTAVFLELVRLSKAHPNSIVTLSRWLADDGFHGYNPVRKVVNRISQKLFARLYRADLTDFTNPTQIAPTALYRSIRWEQGGFDFLPEMTFKPLKLGVPFLEVAGKSLPRQEGRSHSSFRALVLYYYQIVRIYRMDRSEILRQEETN